MKGVHWSVGIYIELEEYFISWLLALLGWGGAIYSAGENTVHIGSHSKKTHTHAFVSYLLLPGVSWHSVHGDVLTI